MGNIIKLYGDFEENILDFMEKFKKREYPRVTRGDFDNHWLARWEADLKIIQGEVHDAEVQEKIHLVNDILINMHKIANSASEHEQLFSLSGIVNRFTIQIEFMRQRVGYLRDEMQKKRILPKRL